VKRRDPGGQLEFLLAEVLRLQLRVYNRRFRATGLNQSELSERLGIEKAALGALIDGLEGKALVERARSREDRRLQLVSITEAGERVVDEIDRMGEALGTEYRSGITREERAQFVSTLQRIRRNLREMEKRDRE
jgi:DNA-binding MarR family transcriptional regulator